MHHTPHLRHPALEPTRSRSATGRVETLSHIASPSAESVDRLSPAGILDDDDRPCREHGLQGGHGIPVGEPAGDVAMNLPSRKIGMFECFRGSLLAATLD